MNKKNKKTKVNEDVKIQEDLIKENIDEENEDDENIINPGDCIGHWLDGDKSCEICEIQDSCKNMTININKDDNENK